MADQWYYGENHERLGPYSATQLKELKVLGRLQATDMVWKEGITNGMLAGNIRGLFDIVPIETTVVDPSLLPVLEVAPLASDELGEEIIPESLELRSIPDDKMFAARAAKARLAAQTRYGTGGPEPGSSANGPDAKTAQRVEPAIAEQARAHAPSTTIKPRRATALSGAIIVSQDGERVRFKKKCIRCGFEESTKSVLRIQSGINRQMFCCTNCHKQVELSIRGI